MTIILIEGEPGALHLRQVESSLTSEEGGDFDFNALMCDVCWHHRRRVPEAKNAGRPCKPASAFLQDKKQALSRGSPTPTKNIKKNNGSSAPAEGC